MITPDEIKRLFELSRIEASARELEKFPKELDAILKYVEKLKSAPLGNLPPTLSFAGEAGELRKDKAVPLDAADVEFLKNSFPEREAGYLKTKKVFGD